MNVRSIPRARLSWALLLAAAAIVPSCSSGHSGSSSAASPVGSSNPSVSAGGNLVAFDSNAALDAAGSSSNGSRGIFLFDRAAGTTRQLTPQQTGAASGDSSNPVISADGQWVAFQSTSSALTGTSTGTSTTGTTGRIQIFIINVVTGQTRLVSGGPAGDFSNGDNVNPSISADGQRVAFESNATNMIAGTPTASSLGRKQVFVWSMASNQIQLVSQTAGGGSPNADSTNPSISADGRFVGFQSAAGNLGAGSSGSTVAGRVRIVLRDLQVGITTIVTPDPATGTGALNGDSANPSLSGDGRFVTFESTASNLPAGGVTIVQTGHTNIFVWDRLSGQSVLVTVAAPPGTTITPADADSHNPSISGDGRFVAFDSKAGNLLGASTSGGSTSATTSGTTGGGSSGTTASGGSNVFVRDLLTGTTLLLSQPGAPGTTTGGTTGASTGSSATGTSAGTTPTAAAAAPQGNSANPAISQDGAWVAFVSDSSSLTSGTLAAGSNIFLANPSTGALLLVTQAPPATTTAGTSGTATTGATTGTTMASTGATTTTTTAGTTGTTVGATGVTTTGMTTGMTTGFTTTGTTAATTGVTTTGVTTGFATAGTTGGTTGATTTGTSGTASTGMTTTGITTGFSTGGTTSGASGGTTFGTTGTTTLGTTTFGTTSFGTTTR